jgi:membrane protein
MFLLRNKKKIKEFVIRAFVLNANRPRKSVTSPRAFTARDWHFIILESRHALKKSHAAMLASGTAFYTTLAFFPLVAAAIAFVAYSIDIGQLNSALNSIEMYFPIDIAGLIGTQLQSAYEYSTRNIFIAVGAIVIALASATRAMLTLVSSVNAAYEQKEKRSAIVVLGMSFVMALGAIILTAILLSLVLVDQSFLQHLGMPALLATLLPFVRWVLLAAVITVSLAIFYRIAPSNHNPHWKWVSWGAGIASVIWLAGTTLFFLYAKYLSIYSNVYNVFGSIIVLLVWFNLTSYIVLLGATINHRLEQRTTRRTTR